ncbi:MAG: hypothetical protein GEU73_14305 [Chloroflexi bacterium]|nr:hypothetical protein [Chloroflexota bacterium]
MTHGDGLVRLEQALARSEADADAALKAAASVSQALKKLRAAARDGNLRELRPAIAAAEQAMIELRQQVANAEEGWDFDEDGYLGSPAFMRELVETARGMNVRIFEQDDRLYCYPALVRVLPNERAVLIDKTRERRLRPSVLGSHLKEVQRRQPRFRPEQFLESLLEAYSALVARRGRRLSGDGPVEKLLDVYNLFTLLPGSSREYSRHEFARDIYLLDRSAVDTTRRGYRLSFSASTGTRTAGSTVRVITEHGEEKVYYGIAFSAPG